MRCARKKSETNPIPDSLSFTKSTFFTLPNDEKRSTISSSVTSNGRLPTNSCAALFSSLYMVRRRFATSSADSSTGAASSPSRSRFSSRGRFVPCRTSLPTTLSAFAAALAADASWALVSASSSLRSRRPTRDCHPPPPFFVYLPISGVRRERVCVRRESTDVSLGQSR